MNRGTQSLLTRWKTFLFGRYAVHRAADDEDADRSAHQPVPRRIVALWVLIGTTAGLVIYLCAGKSITRSPIHLLELTLRAVEADALLSTVALVSIALLLLMVWKLVLYDRNIGARYLHYFELKLLAKRLDFLSRYANDAMVLSDLNGTILEANDRSLDCYGYAREEMIGKNVGELLAPHLRNDQQTIMKKLAACESRVYENETENIRKDGRPFPAEISARMIEIDGESYFQWIVRDITARKRMKQSLLSSEEHFRQAFNHAPISMAMLGLDGRFLAVNAATCRLTGYSQTELATMTYSDFVGRAEAESDEDWLEELDAHAGGPNSLEIQARHKDGRILDLSINFSMIQGDDGKPLHILYQALDLTEGKRAAARIERLSRLKAALSDTNRAILYSRSPEEVYRAVCQACVAHGDILLAWVGLADPDAQRITPIEAAGPASGYLDGIVISTRADAPEGQAPSAIAYREKCISVCGDFSASGAMAPWRERAAAHGLTSSIALPILRGGGRYGTLNVYAAERHSYDEEVVEQLREMAQNISFAIDQFDRDAERRQAESALRRSEERFRTLVENLPHPVFVKNADLVFISSNAAFARRIGIASDQIAGKTDFDFFPAALAERHEGDCRRVMASGEVAELQERFIVDGHERFFHTLKAPVRDEQGKITGVLGAFWDITESKRAEMALRQYAEEVEDLYQDAPCGYHSVAADSTLTRINNTELRWLGYTREEVVRRMKVDELFTPPSIRKFQERFPRFKKTGEMRDIEVEMVCKDGTILPVSLNATAIFDAAGEYVSSRVTTHDIGERVMLKREQMRNAKRLKNLSHRLIAVQEEERRRLSTELHDRASPNLAAIKITLATLSGSLPPQMQADVASHLSDAIALLDDTTAGIRDICADLRPAMLDYSGLIPALEAYAVQFMKRTAITVRVKVPQADQIRFGKHEESALFRIVQEALMNCAKHACASTVDIELAKTNGQTTLTIKDNGFGFAAATTERPNRRSGLGLITMKERTEFMGGKLIVTSLPLWGTEIRVTLANRRTPQLRTRTAPLGLESHPLYSGPGQTMSN